MAEPQETEKAKLFCAVLCTSAELLPEVKAVLENLFGPVDIESETMAFESTSYYEADMGKHLVRKFYAFEPLLQQDLLAGTKLTTNALEKEFAGKLDVKRPVNLDPGLLLPSKIILASCKNFSHRIYLGKGVYAEITLQYSKGVWKTLPWTFPDYRKQEYHDFFTALRQRYMEQR